MPTKSVGTYAPPAEGCRHVMQMAVGYFDESSDEVGGNLCYAVAGLIGSMDATVVLELKWKDLLDEYELAYFKASELNAGEGEFRKFRDDPSAQQWTPFSPREKMLLKDIKTRFTDVIVSSRGLYWIGAVVVLPDFERVRAQYPAAKILPEPYFLCSGLVLMEAGQQMLLTNSEIPSPHKGFLKPVFDSHEAYSGRVKQGYDLFCEKNPLSATYLLPPDYEPEEKHMSLQAADDFVYEVRRALVRKVTGYPPKERVSMSRIKDTGSIIRIYKLNYTGLKILCDAQESDVMPDIETMAEGPLLAMRDDLLLDVGE